MPVWVQWKMTIASMHVERYTQLKRADLFLLFTFTFLFIHLKMLASISVLHIKSLDSSILHVCAALIHFICSPCVFSLFRWSWIIAGQREQTKKKKKINMKRKCMTTALGSRRTAHWGPFLCACERHKERTISLGAKMRLGNWIEHFRSPKWKWLSHIRRTYGVWSKAIRWRHRERNARESEETTGNTKLKLR